MTPHENRRILLVDDTPSIHEDFRKILTRQSAAPELDAAEEALFGRALGRSGNVFELDSARSGEEAAALAEAAVRRGRPYALAFVDMRMPPGWDGVETIERLWRIDPALQVVICTAYSDHPWEEVMARLDVRDRLLVVKKPFDLIEVSQLARTLTAKWQTTCEATAHIERLATAVEDLKASEAALRQSHRELEMLAHSMSHDLRAPLSAMNSFSHLLARELGDAAGGKVSHYISRIRANAAASEQLIDGLLQLDGVSRAEMRREPMDLGALALEILKELQAAQPHRQPTIEVQDGLWVRADRNLLRIAMRHLLGNALKFSAPQAQPHIAVGRQDGPGREAEFFVRDNGLGFDMAHAGQLFVTPQRLHRDPPQHAPGMGLIVVGRIVGRHGGRIRAEAVQDGGATFYFTLPSAGERAAQN
jgi:two-component system, NtrC family, sensor kinase